MTWADVEASGYQRVFANPKVGDVEIWEVQNLSGGWFHPLHIHLVDFQVLSRNGAPPRRRSADRRTWSTPGRTRRCGCSCASGPSTAAT